jgi:hypothetical protein
MTRQYRDVYLVLHLNRFWLAGHLAVCPAQEFYALLQTMWDELVAHGHGRAGTYIFNATEIAIAKRVFVDEYILSSTPSERAKLTPDCWPVP